MSGRSKRKAAAVAEPEAHEPPTKAKRTKRGTPQHPDEPKDPVNQDPFQYLPRSPTAADLIANNPETFESDVQSFSIVHSDSQTFFVSVWAFPGPGGALRVAAGDSVGRVYLYDCTEAKILKTAQAFDRAQLRGLGTVTTAAGVRLLFVGGNLITVPAGVGPKIRKYDADTLELLAELDLLALSVEGIAGLDDKHIAVIYHGGKPHGLQISVATLDGQILRTHHAHPSLCCFRQVSPDVIATTGWDNKLCLYNCFSGASFTANIEQKIEAMATTSNGRYLLIAGGKPRVQVWDLAVPEPRLAHEFKPLAQVTGLMPAWVNDKLHVITREGKDDARVQMYAAETGAKVQAWEKFGPFDPFDPVLLLATPNYVITKSNETVLITRISAPR